MAKTAERTETPGDGSGARGQSGRGGGTGGRTLNFRDHASGIRLGPPRGKDAPPTALRAEMDLAAGATRATTAELVMADMLTGESCVR